MIIDSLADKSSINIDELTIPDVKTESYLTFDPKVDLTKEDFEHGFEEYFFLRGELLSQGMMEDEGISVNFIRRFFLLAESLKFFVPEQKSRLELDLNLFSLLNGEGWNLMAVENKLKFGAALKNVFPEYSARLFTADSGFFRKMVEGRLEDLRKEKKWPAFADAVKEARQLFQEEVTIPPLSKNDWVSVAGGIKQFRSGGGVALFDGIVRIVSSMRLAYPESKELLGVNETMWQWMRGKIEAGRGKMPWDTFFDLAYHMAILAADEVKITSDGEIAVVMRKPDPELKEKIPDMPIKRAF